jgi:uncharacterized protein
MMTTNWAELLITDHQTSEQVFEAVEKAFAAPDGPSCDTIAKLVEYCRDYVTACHNQKEEQHLFPLIERRGIPRHGGPLAVMLDEHRQAEQALAKLVELGTLYSNGRTSVREDLQAVFSQYATLMRNHFWKENDILYPMARRVMTEADAAQVVEGIEKVEASLGPDTRARYYALAQRLMDGLVKDLAFGLDQSVIAAILNSLPIELSFVDADDRVRYFSHENHAKLFPRTRGVIGRPVQMCHPEKSVHMVNAIIKAFKAGERSVAEFWITMGGKHIHIRYFAVRDPQGAYLGCLEAVQDVTAIRQLTGERRLLDEALG